MFTLPNNPRSAALLAAAAVMFVGSVLPVWCVWRIYPEMWEGVGDFGTLWRVAVWLPNNIRGEPRPAMLLDLHSWNLVGLAILSTASAAVGARVYVVKRRRLGLGSVGDPGDRTLTRTG